MRKIFGITGIFVLCLLAASLAFAQQETVTGGQAGQSPMNMNASDILDKDVVNRQGEKLGKIDDLVLDEKGQIQSVILSSGGFIGIGGEKYTLQWDRFQFQVGENDQLVADIQEADLERFQADAGQPAEREPRPMAREGQPVEEKQATSQEPSAAAQTESRQAESTMTAEGQKSVEDTKDWIGKSVSGNDGEELGTVNNLYIGSEGNVQYVVISSEDNKLHPVPIELVSQKQDGEELQAEFSKDVFQNSVSFAQTEAPNLGEPDWEDRIRGFYADEGLMKSDQKGMEKKTEKGEMKEKKTEKGEMKEKKTE